MADNKADTTTKADIDKNKTMAILAYFIFFLPLLTDAKDSKFAKFHANQALLVTLIYIAGFFLSFFLIGFLVYILGFVLWIMGIISAVNGEMKRLPLIGNIEIIK